MTARAHYRQLNEEREAFARRAQDIWLMIADDRSADEIKAAIIAAMKWAQTQ